jgi:menaquinone-dependent protoporphyrinogen oxidase
MKVLVTVATRHGSAAEIAQDLAEALRTRLPDGSLEMLPAAQIDDVTRYDAVILGSEVPGGRWLAEARRVAAVIAGGPSRAVWLFSSGPVDAPLRAARLRPELDDIIAASGAREHRFFAGRMDHDRGRFQDGSVLAALQVAAHTLADWDEVDAWGARIAAELSRRAAVAEPFGARV